MLRPDPYAIPLIPLFSFDPKIVETIIGSNDANVIKEF